MFDEALICSARESYNDTYASEMEINSKFKQYVHNYKAAFEGKNTKRKQVLDPRKKKKLSNTECNIIGCYNYYCDVELLN